MQQEINAIMPKQLVKKCARKLRIEIIDSIKVTCTETVQQETLWDQARTLPAYVFSLQNDFIWTIFTFLPLCISLCVGMEQVRLFIGFTSGYNSRAQFSF